MEIYILAIIFLLIFGLVTKKNSKCFLIVAFFILTTISALRDSSVGTDAQMYCRGYNLIGMLSSFRQLSDLRYEYGFSIFCKLLTYINTNPQLFLIISSIIINGSVFYFINKNSESKKLSVILYITLNIYFTYMNIIRQAIAIGILLIAYEFFKKENYIKYSLLVLLATTFHTSALIMLIMIPSKKFYINNTRYIVIVIVSILMAILGRAVVLVLFKLVSVYSVYSTLSYFEPNYFGAIITAMLTFIISTSYYIVIGRKEDNIQKDNISKALIYSMIFSFASISTNIITRIGTYFFIFSIIAIPNIIKQLNARKETKLLLKVVVILVSMIYCFIILKYKPEWDCVVPYKFFWEA